MSALRKLRAHGLKRCAKARAGATQQCLCWCRSPGDASKNYNMPLQYIALGEGGKKTSMGR